MTVHAVKLLGVLVRVLYIFNGFINVAAKKGKLY